MLIYSLGHFLANSKDLVKFAQNIFDIIMGIGFKPAIYISNVIIRRICKSFAIKSN